MNAKDIVRELVELRLAEEMRQVDVAAAVGVSQPVISEFESGKTSPRLDTIIRYAAALGYRVELVKDVEGLE